MDCAATPALPAEDSGRIRPTLTWPLPTASGCCCGPAGPGSDELNGLENELRLCWTPEQAPGKAAPRITLFGVPRAVPGPPDLRWSGPAILFFSIDRPLTGPDFSTRGG